MRAEALEAVATHARALRAFADRIEAAQKGVGNG